MSAITPVLAAMRGELVTEILLIVAALAGLVGISILVAYGFGHLRSAAGVDSGYGGVDDAGMPEGSDDWTGTDSPYGGDDRGGGDYGGDHFYTGS